MKSFLKYLIKFLAGVLPAGLRLATIRALAEKAEENQEQFFTYHLRPHKAAATPSLHQGHPDVAMVMQGPALLENDFTLHTLALYRKLYPGSPLIWSTWQNTDPELVERARNVGVQVVLSDPPDIAGFANVNFQIVSTQAGIAAAAAYNPRFVVKTRSDQRLYQAGALHMIGQALQKFPLQSHGPQQARILATSLNTFKYRPYSVSDMLVAGTLADMQRFWSVPEDARSGRPEYPDLISWSKAEMVEVYLVVHFLRQLGMQIEWGLKASWKIMAERFLILDHESLDLYWPKYDRMLEFRYRKYGAGRTDEELRFAEWLAMQDVDWSALDVDESILNKPFATNL